MNFKLIVLIICSALKLEENNLVLGLLSASSNREGGGGGGGGVRDRRQQCVLPSIQNGMVRLRQRGKLAKFQCYKSFNLIGNVYAGCAGGKWDTPIPVCAKAGCNDISPPENGFIMVEHDGAASLLFCREGYQIAGGRQTFCNGTKWDRPLGSCRETQTTSLRLCDFEVEDLCGWTHDDTDDFEWKRILGHEIGSRRLRTGPQHDHTTQKSYGGHYMLVESFNHLPDDRARLISPVYASKLSKDACFKFFYHMYGASVGDLRIYVKPLSVDINVATQDRKYLYFELNGNQGNKWREGVVFLEKLDENFQIIIEGSAGTSHLGDIAIDDVALLDENECIGDAIETTTTETEESGGVFDIQSCKNRCDETTSISQQSESIKNGTRLIKTCDCHNGCEDLMTCCPDYRSICAFGTTYLQPEEYTTEIQEIKTTTLKPTTTTAKPTTSTTRPTTSTLRPTATTAKPTTTTAKSTTSTLRPTTTTLRPTTTTLRPTTTTAKPTTSTARPTTTTAKSTTSTLKPTTTTLRPTTSTLRPTTTTAKPTTTTLRPTTTTLRPTTSTLRPTTTTAKPTTSTLRPTTTTLRPSNSTTRITSTVKTSTKATSIKTTSRVTSTTTIRPINKATARTIKIRRRPTMVSYKIIESNITELPIFKLPQSTTKIPKTSTTKLSPLLSSHRPNEEQQDDPQYIATDFVKSHEWKINQKFSDNDEDYDKNYLPIWLIVFISFILTICLIAFIIFSVNYYRYNYGPQNYKNNKRKFSKNHEINSEMRFLTFDEQLDFRMQRPDDNPDDDDDDVDNETTSQNKFSIELSNKF